MFGTKERKSETNEAQGVTYLPAVDITETEAGYTIYADVPGAHRDSVNVTYENGVVTLSANGEATGETKKDGLIHREFRRASYERAFRVGDDVDAEAISAEIANGVLQVKLPRKASAAKKTISVSAK
jgi:HSP20 family protein